MIDVPSGWTIAEARDVGRQGERRSSQVLQSESGYTASIRLERAGSPWSRLWHVESSPADEERGVLHRESGSAGAGLLAVVVAGAIVGQAVLIVVRRRMRH